MPSPTKRPEPRFSLNDIVEVSSAIHTTLTGRKARIIGVHANRFARTLDKYTIVLLGAPPDREWALQRAAGRFSY